MKVPVYLGNLRGPEGNAFNVLGQCKQSVKQLDEAGIPVPDETRAFVDGEWMEHSYEENLEIIEAFFDDLDGSIADFRYGNDFDMED